MKRIFSLLVAAVTLLLCLGSCAPELSEPQGSSAGGTSESESKTSTDDEWEGSILERELSDYKIVSISDTHLYDWESLIFESSAQRIAWAVQELLEEHRKRGAIDVITVNGDIVNNWVYEYEAGVFEPSTQKTSENVFGGWGDFKLNGVTYSSRYKGVTYSAGSSGTANDPLGVLRILSFCELLEPLEEAGISILYVNGNHDCFHDTVWEMGFQMNQKDGYLGGIEHYQTDGSGALIVPSYQIVDNELVLYDRKIKTSDPDYLTYANGYGPEYAFGISQNTAFAVYDTFNYSGDQNGFEMGGTASGRAWHPTPVTQKTVDAMNQLLVGYSEIYIAIHSDDAGSPELWKDVKASNEETPGRIVAVLDGHTHYETVTPNYQDTGAYRLTCGYISLPARKPVRDNPYSYRITEKKDGRITSCMALFQYYYPAYTFTQSYLEGFSFDAFYQPYRHRGEVVLREAE